MGDPLIHTQRNTCSKRISDKATMRKEKQENMSPNLDT